jgi:hypothetical protein
MFLGSKEWSVRRADNLAVICEPAVYTSDDQLAARGPDPTLGFIYSGPRQI